MKIILMMLLIACNNIGLNYRNKIISDDQKIIDMQNWDERAIKEIIRMYGESDGFASGKYHCISTIGAIVTEFTSFEEEETERIIINYVKDYIKYDPLRNDQEQKTTIHRIIERGFKELFHLYIQEKGIEILKRIEKNQVYKYISIDAENEYCIKELFNMFYKDSKEIKDDIMFSPLEYALMRNKPKATKAVIDAGDEIRWSSRFVDMYSLFLSKVSKELKEYIIRSQL